MDPASALGSVFAGFGLSGAAGLNAWLPLFVSALLERTDVVHLAQPVETLSSNTGLAALGALMLADVVADKVPLVDHVAHLVGTVVAPVSGAFLFVAQTADHSNLSALVAVLVGGGTATAIHVGRSALRGVSTATTAGVGSPLLSTGEDLCAGALIGAAFLVPLLAFALVGLLVLALLLGARRLRAGLRPRGRAVA